MKRFDNRTVIVTGGARGMGASSRAASRPTARRLWSRTCLSRRGGRLAAELADHAHLSPACAGTRARQDPRQLHPPWWHPHPDDRRARHRGARGGGCKDLAIPRIAEPEEITRLVLFVASDEAGFATGSEFVADGGHLLGPVPQLIKEARK